jgi:hypothetical protein
MNVPDTTPQPANLPALRFLEALTPHGFDTSERLTPERADQIVEGFGVLTASTKEWSGEFLAWVQRDLSDLHGLYLDVMAERLRVTRQTMRRRQQRYEEAHELPAVTAQQREQRGLPHKSRSTWRTAEEIVVVGGVLPLSTMSDDPERGNVKQSTTPRAERDVIDATATESDETEADDDIPAWGERHRPAPTGDTAAAAEQPDDEAINEDDVEDDGGFERLTRTQAIARQLAPVVEDIKARNIALDRAQNLNHGPARRPSTTAFPERDVRVGLNAAGWDVFDQTARRCNWTDDQLATRAVMAFLRL